MKKIIKIILIIIVVVLVIGIAVIAGLLISQKDNVSAVINAATADKEQLVENIETSREEHQSVLEERGVTVTPPSLDDIEGILDGRLTKDDIINGITNVSPQDNTEENTDTPSDNSVSTPSDTTEPVYTPAPQETVTDNQQNNGANANTGTSESSAPSESEAPDQIAAEEPAPVKTEQEIIEKYVNALYEYELDLFEKLAVMKKEALAEYNAIPNRTQEDLINIGLAGLDKCYVMEAEVDDVVRGELDKLKLELEEIGADTAIAKQLWEYYCDEKANFKAYYINKYLK